MRRTLKKHQFIFFTCIALCFFKTYAQPKTIPVVFHVVHKGEPYGTGYNLSDVKVKEMLKFMNETYRRIPNTPGYGLPNYGTDTEIQFVLPSFDLNHNIATNGIEHIDGNLIPNYISHGLLNNNSSDGTPSNINVFNQYDWIPSEYMNIYLITHSDEGGYGGFSDPILNKVYISCKFGLPDLEETSRIINHELGHRFGLNHTFESYGNVDIDGCPTNFNCATDGDKICDTPPHKDGMVPPESCSNTGDAFFDTSYYWNIMSYNKKFGFTNGQKVAMQNALINNNSINFLQTSDNLSWTGTKAPHATYVSSGNLCSGSPVQYTYTGGGIPHEITWTFQGGVPASSNELNPTVFFSSGGPHLITLFVKNALGTESASSTTFVAAFNGTLLPFQESFSNVLFPPSGSQVISGDAIDLCSWSSPCRKTWVKQNNMLAINMYSYLNKGQVDQFNLIPISLNNTTHPKLKFSVAYRNYLGSNDQLKVYVKKDCDANYTQVYSKSGATLSTGPSLQNSFTPQFSSDWREETIDLSAYAGHAISIRFETVNDYGNNLYIDNINILAYPTIAIQAETNLFPSCSDIQNKYVAITTDAGSNPIYKWSIDGVEQGVNSDTFQNSFTAGQQVNCQLISNLPAAGTPITYPISNTVSIIPSLINDYYIFIGGIGVYPSTSIKIVNNIITIKSNCTSGKVFTVIAGNGLSGVNCYLLLNVSYVPNLITGGYVTSKIWDLLKYKTGDTIQFITATGNPCPHVSPVYTIINNIPVSRLQPNSERDDMSFSIYPNPSQDIVTIDFDSSKIGQVNTIEVMNLQGQVLLEATPKKDNDGKVIVHFENFAQGTYIIILKTNSGNFSQKLIRE